jgi:hypothetical protein
MGIKELIKFGIGSKNLKSYFAIDKTGEKVFIRAREMPIEDNRYTIVSTCETYIDNLLTK